MRRWDQPGPAQVWSVTRVEMQSLEVEKRLAVGEGPMGLIVF